MSQSQQRNTDSLEKLEMFRHIVVKFNKRLQFHHIPLEFYNGDKMDVDDESNISIDSPIMVHFKNISFVSPLQVYFVSTCYQTFPLRIINEACKAAEINSMAEINTLIAIYAAKELKRGLRFCRKENSTYFSFFINKVDIKTQELHTGVYYRFDSDRFYFLDQDMINTAMAQKRKTINKVFK